MAHVALVGTGTVTSNASSGQITVTTAVPAGQTVLGGVVWEAGGGAGIPTVSSITDTRGNSYTVDVSAGGSSNVTDAGAIFRGLISTALQVGDQITITISGGTRNRWAMQADAFDDVNASSPLDKTQHADNGSGTSMSTGATAATTQAYEVVYAIFGFNAARTFTLDTGWSGTAQVNTSGGSADRALQCIYKYTAAAGAQTGTGTQSSNSVYCGAIATYKATLATQIVNGSADLAAAGTLTAAGTNIGVASAAPSAASTVLAAGSVTEIAAAAPAAAATLTVSGSATVLATAVPSATSTLAASGSVTVRAAAAASASASISAAAAVSTSATAALAAEASLSAAGVRGTFTSAALAAAGALDAAASVVTSVSADLTAGSAATADGVVTVSASAELAATATLTAVPGATLATADLSAAGVLTAVARVDVEATAGLSAAGGLSVTFGAVTGSAALSATANLTVEASKGPAGAAALSAAAGLAAVPLLRIPAAAELTALAHLTAVLPGGPTRGQMDGRDRPAPDTLADARDGARTAVLARTGPDADAVFRSGPDSYAADRGGPHATARPRAGTSMGGRS